MAIVEWLVPVASMAMTAFITWTIVWYFVKRAEFRTRPNEEFKRLAEEAVRGQRIMADESKKMADSVKEIQRLMSKV